MVPLSSTISENANGCDPATLVVLITNEYRLPFLKMATCRYWSAVIPRMSICSVMRNLPGAVGCSR